MDDHPSDTSGGREIEHEAAMTFGQKLKAERESQGLSLENVAETTRIGMHLLEALERDDFDALPGNVFVRGHLRAYAECLNADPELVIEAYKSERRKRGVEPADIEEDDATAVVKELARVLNASNEQKTKPRNQWVVWLAACAVTAVLAILGTWWVVSRAPGPQAPQSEANESAVSPPAASGPVGGSPAASGPVGGSPVASAPVGDTPAASAPDVGDFTSSPDVATTVPVEAPAVVAPAEASPSPPEQAVEAARVEPGPPVEMPVPALPEATTVSIPDYGVGTAVENRQLVGQAARFSEGTKVWFWTDVRGGSGETIDHVWLREGVEASRVSLSIGAARWRTQSNKQLWPGSAGEWAVEARDGQGRVLARSEFVCVP